MSMILFDTNIIIENDTTGDISEEITKDLIEIVTVYSSKIHGSRSYKKEEKEESV